MKPKNVYSKENLLKKIFFERKASWKKIYWKKILPEEKLLRRNSSQNLERKSRKNLLERKSSQKEILGTKFYMCDSHTASIIVENALFYCPSRLLLWQWTRPHRHWKNKNRSHFYLSINIQQKYPKNFIVFALAQNAEIGIIE